MSVVAVVLARGGSKGLPGKNTADVAGKPCVQWTIEAALRAELVDRVIVSSDDERVLEIGRDLGAIAHDRPAALASDTATVDDAVREAVRDDDAHTVAILYGNVPVRPDGLIDECVRTLLENGADSTQSYAPVGKYHPWWTARVDVESGIVRPWEGEVLNHGVFRRQDLPEAVIPDGGALVVSRRALFLEIEGVAAGPHAFFGLDRRGVMNDEGAVVDIDSRVDLLVADALMRERLGIA